MACVAGVPITRYAAQEVAPGAEESAPDAEESAPDAEESAIATPDAEGSAIATRIQDGFRFDWLCIYKRCVLGGDKKCFFVKIIIPNTILPIFSSRPFIVSIGRRLRLNVNNINCW